MFVKSINWLAASTNLEILVKLIYQSLVLGVYSSSNPHIPNITPICCSLVGFYPLEGIFMVVHTCDRVSKSISSTCQHIEVLAELVI